MIKPRSSPVKVGTVKGCSLSHSLFLAQHHFVRVATGPSLGATLLSFSECETGDFPCNGKLFFDWAIRRLLMVSLIVRDSVVVFLGRRRSSCVLTI